MSDPAQSVAEQMTNLLNRIVDLSTIGEGTDTQSTCSCSKNNNRSNVLPTELKIFLEIASLREDIEDILRKLKQTLTCLVSFSLKKHIFFFFL